MFLSALPGTARRELFERSKENFSAWPRLLPHGNPTACARAPFDGSTRARTHGENGEKSCTARAIFLPFSSVSASLALVRLMGPGRFAGISYSVVNAACRKFSYLAPASSRRRSEGQDAVETRESGARTSRGSRGKAARRRDGIRKRLGAEARQDMKRPPGRRARGPERGRAEIYFARASSSSTSSEKSRRAEFTGSGEPMSTPAILRREIGSAEEPPERNFL